MFGLLSPNAGVIVDKFIEIQKASELPATAILWGSFGKDTRWIDRYLTAMDGRENVVEIHFSNESGRRNGRLGAGDIMPYSGVAAYNERLETMTEEMEEIIGQRAVEILEFRDSYPKNTRWILSLGLESNYTEDAALNILAIISDVWHYEIAYNPLDGNCNHVPDWVYCETHGYNATPKPPRCIISGDGQDAGPRAVVSAGNRPATMSEVRDFIQRGSVSNCITLLWSAQTQGVDRAFVPTLDRSFRLDDPTFIYFRELVSGQVKAIEGATESALLPSKDLFKQSLDLH
jgi:hypothetical protein